MQRTSTRISLIAAVAENRVIGQGNTLPWHLPADLQHFKQLTLDKPMIMGRRTWQSLPGLLAGRRHIVVSKNPGFAAQGCEIAHNLTDALRMAGSVPEVMIIGGATFYRQMLPFASRMYLTLVHAEVEGDVFFPRYDDADWIELSRESHTADEKNRYDYTFLTLERVHQ